ncbi:PilN domain-containing protein [Flavobacterium sp. GSA192]|uniref:PilN domain-containing protein n=1 Tax=Flavobacterium sp. GSA192 TaxID=2576304 RepID=UPI001125BA59|nr:PilN domain-containing protein [Flavobacterium sp. GSA192]
MKFPSLSAILLGNQYISIEHFSTNGEEMIAILLVENKKEELRIVKKDKVNYNGTIPDKWDKKLPFILTVNTNQVIQKEVAGTDVADEKLLHKAFPNTNWDEFYFEIWRLQTKSIIAISRKTYIEPLIEEYAKQGITIAGINLGVCSLSEIISYTEKDTFTTNHQTVSWNEDNPIITATSENSESNYEINGLSIQSSHMLAFSAILGFLVQNSKNTGNTIELSQKKYNDYLQHRFFSKGGKLMVGILLGILLINFFVFSHYYNVAQETDVNLMLNKSSLEEISQTKQRILSKEQKLKTVIAGTQSQSTALLNEIAKRVPASVLLTELVYQPLEKKIKAEETISTSDKIITISGTTVNNLDFTVWIEGIEKLSWINEVVITHFGKNDANETQFAIKLILR